MPAQLDLDAYFARVRFGGDTRPTLDTLTALLRAHMTQVPFENLDVLLGRGVRIDLDGVQAKLVSARRGGYCFEHATLFAAALEAIGFRVARHMARVTVFVPRDAAARTHMFLAVPLAEGTFVADPGFGGLAPTFPVPLVDRAEAPTGAATHWMARDDGAWVLRARTPEKIVDAWVSPVDVDNLVDFEVGNHFTATHPASPFRARLMMRAFGEGARVSVMNRDVTVVDERGTRTSTLANRSALRALLVERFGFDLPEVESMRVPQVPEWA